MSVPLWVRVKWRSSVFIARWISFHGCLALTGYINNRSATFDLTGYIKSCNTSPVPAGYLCCAKLTHYMCRFLPLVLQFILYSIHAHRKGQLLPTGAGHLRHSNFTIVWFFFFSTYFLIFANQTALYFSCCCVCWTMCQYFTCTCTGFVLFKQYFEAVAPAIH